MGSKDCITAKDFMRLADFLTSNGFRLGPKIGEGAYSKVRIAERTLDGEILAAKIIDKRKAKKIYVHRFLPRELEIAAQVKHKNVISTHEILYQEDLVFIIMDYAEKGDLLSLIRMNGYLPEEEGKKMFREIVEAIEYLHSLGITHRDLKCENILIMRDKRITVSDFGFSRHYAKNEQSTEDLCRTFCGSGAYASPELLRGKPYDPQTNDIWSMGCILFVMVCGTMPFDDSNFKLMMKKQLTGQIVYPNTVNDKLSVECKDLIRCILEPNTDKRANIQQILDSEWLKCIPE